MWRRTLGLLVLAVTLLAGGCAAPAAREPLDLVIQPGRYSAAFDAAREGLIELGFELERVDARLGIITSRPKTTTGLASPWDREQSTPVQEIEEFFNRHQRRATVTFRLMGETEHIAPAPQTSPAAAPADLREAAGPIIARVEITLERHRRSGWRLEPTAMRFSSRTLDPEQRGTGLWPSYNVPFSQDPQLAGRVAARMRSAASAQ